MAARLIFKSVAEAWDKLSFETKVNFAGVYPRSAKTLEGLF
jgi:hypothetical protein